MESPETASEIAWPMVLQAVEGDVQWLLSLPLTPFTYRVLAQATEPSRHRAVSSMLDIALRFMIVSSLSRNYLLWLRSHLGATMNMMSSVSDISRQPRLSASHGCRGSFAR